MFIEKDIGNMLKFPIVRGWRQQGSVNNKIYDIYDTNTSAFILKSLKFNHSVIFRQ